jgi:hypothetical protein
MWCSVTCCALGQWRALSTLGMLWQLTDQREVIGIWGVWLWKNSCQDGIYLRVLGCAIAASAGGWGLGRGAVHVAGTISSICGYHSGTISRRSG